MALTRPPVRHSAMIRVNPQHSDYQTNGRCRLAWVLAGAVLVGAGCSDPSPNQDSSKRVMIHGPTGELMRVETKDSRFTVVRDQKLPGYDQSVPAYRGPDGDLYYVLPADHPMSGIAPETSKPTSQ